MCHKPGGLWKPSPHIHKRMRVKTKYYLIIMRKSFDLLDSLEVFGNPYLPWILGWHFDKCYGMGEHFRMMRAFYDVNVIYYFSMSNSTVMTSYSKNRTRKVALQFHKESSLPACQIIDKISFSLHKELLVEKHRN